MTDNTHPDWLWQSLRRPRRPVGQHTCSVKTLERVKERNLGKWDRERQRIWHKYSKGRESSDVCVFVAIVANANSAHKWDFGMPFYGSTLTHSGIREGEIHPFASVHKRSWCDCPDVKCALYTIWDELKMHRIQYLYISKIWFISYIISRGPVSLSFVSATNNFLANNIIFLLIPPL